MTELSGTLRKAFVAALSLSIVGVSCLFSSLGQERIEAGVEVSAQVDRNTITVGDLLTLKVQVFSDPGTIVRLPGPKAELGAFDIRDYRVDEPTEVDGGRLLSQATYVLTAFETGKKEIPALTIRYLSSVQGEEREALTDPIPIVVESVLEGETKDISDIKPPMEIPRDWVPLGLALLAGILIATIAVILWFYLRRHRGKAAEQIANSEPSLPPHELALDALKKLKAEKLIEKGRVSHFHIRISEIIRRYLEGRFGIEALEMTSGEVLVAIADRNAVEGLGELASEFLTQCDLVKFAKHLPTRERCERMFEVAFRIVELTRQEAVTTALDSRHAKHELSGVIPTPEQRSG